MLTVTKGLAALYTQELELDQFELTNKRRQVMLQEKTRNQKLNAHKIIEELSCFEISSSINLHVSDGKMNRIVLSMIG